MLQEHSVPTKRSEKIFYVIKNFSFLLVLCKKFFKMSIRSAELSCHIPLRLPEMTETEALSGCVPALCSSSHPVHHWTPLSTSSLPHDGWYLGIKQERSGHVEAKALWKEAAAHTSSALMEQPLEVGCGESGPSATVECGLGTATSGTALLGCNQIFPRCTSCCDMFMRPDPFPFVSIGVRRGQGSGLKPMISLLNKTIAPFYLPPQRAWLINFHLVLPSWFFFSPPTFSLTRRIFPCPKTERSHLLPWVARYFGSFGWYPALCFNLWSASQDC